MLHFKKIVAIKLHLKHLQTFFTIRRNHHKKLIEKKKLYIFQKTIFHIFFNSNRMYLYYIYNTSKYLASNIPLPQSCDEKILRSPLSKSRCAAISFIVQLVMSAAITLLNTFNRQRIGRGSHFRSARIRGEAHGLPSSPRGNAVEAGLRILSYVDRPLITGRARAYGIQ